MHHYYIYIYILPSILILSLCTAMLVVEEAYSIGIVTESAQKMEGI